ncbi:hypothetical protein VT84_19945 [Gemmata sp. SH-PL17]|uniref:hypothetical protein n=1 Tax=Gemmata sp. SH-PL17 TaxID=1630693 RepID=UPI0004B55CED|nr:hypothetical protein [Gemmata sp. SH-PL17]AMV26682.1 hypothetical protein VT84_19945 [Gemmata sp. SH-PL17]
MNDSRPWWLWPNVLSLDAPAVAVTWQVFLASVAGIAVPLAASIVLALVVWSAYLIDRGLDAHRGADGSDRHRAAGRNPVAWMVGAGAALVGAVALTFTALPRTQIVVGFVVLGAAVSYFAAVHLSGAKKILGRGFKEASVGVVFAAGVAIPLIADAEPYTNWLPGVIAFAGLCWLNCALISRWEDGADRGHPLWLAIVVGGLAVGVALGAPTPVATAIVASTVALAALHLLRARLSDRAKRVLVDAVLLTPILVAVGL